MTNKNVVIIGSGPSGISTALYTVRSNIDTTIITKGIGALKNATIQNYYGVGTISGKELYEKSIEQAKELGVKIVETEVVGINYEKTLVVNTLEGDFHGNCVVIATGSERNLPNITNLKKFEHNGVSFCAICDAFFYRNKNIAVLGYENYALHEIEVLNNVTHNITLLTNGNTPTANFPENIKIDCRKVSEIFGNDRIEGIIFENGEKLNIDGLFIAYGSCGATSLAKKIGVKVENNKIVVNENMQTNIKGLYAVGDCIGGLQQVSKSVADGAIAGINIIKELK